jgi:aryl-alcohol dehydrogenase-like predicted oxidoreductase
MIGEITTLGGQPASRLGLAGRPGMEAGCVSLAHEAGVNYFFFYDLSAAGLLKGLKPLLARARDQVVVATGSEERAPGALRRYLEKVRQKLDVEQVDVFFAEYVSPQDDLEEVHRALEELHAWKEKGLIRRAGATAHSRALALELVRGRCEVLMHRYNMAHRKSEDQVLPAALEAGVPVVAFTCTRWGSLLEGHREWKGEAPTAADCYRFALRHPAVRVALTAPETEEQLRENLAVLHRPALSQEEAAHWAEYGALVYGEGKDSFETEWP